MEEDSRGGGLGYEEGPVEFCGEVGVVEEDVEAFFVEFGGGVRHFGR